MLHAFGSDVSGYDEKRGVNYEVGDDLIGAEANHRRGGADSLSGGFARQRR